MVSEENPGSRTNLVVSVACEVYKLELETGCAIIVRLGLTYERCRTSHCYGVGYKFVSRTLETIRMEWENRESERA